MTGIYLGFIKEKIGFYPRKQMAGSLHRLLLLYQLLLWKLFEALGWN
jgi:hypothetical protein